MDEYWSALKRIVEISNPAPKGTLHISWKWQNIFGVEEIKQSDELWLQHFEESQLIPMSAQPLLKLESSNLQKVKI